MREKIDWSKPLVYCAEFDEYHFTAEYIGKINNLYPYLVKIKNKFGDEWIAMYDDYGIPFVEDCFAFIKNKKDLKEGWVNILREGAYTSPIYDTKEKALEARKLNYSVVDTVKIEWYD